MSDCCWVTTGVMSLKGKCCVTSGEDDEKLTERWYVRLTNPFPTSQLSSVRWESHRLSFPFASYSFLFISHTYRYGSKTDYSQIHSFMVFGFVCGEEDTFHLCDAGRAGQNNSWASVYSVNGFCIIGSALTWSRCIRLQWIHIICSILSAFNIQ